MIEIKLAISKEFFYSFLSVATVILLISMIVISIQDKDWFHLFISISMAVIMICAVVKAVPA